MRLINAHRLEFEFFENEARRPKYAILSHRWIDKQEVTYHEFLSQSNLQKIGWEKIRFCCKQALADGLEWVWIDTCCIDKTSSAELTEAINSMFQWYGSAGICFAYLNDVSESDESSFESSLWFTRAWTLQELLAPANLKFYDLAFKFIGTKNDLISRLEVITDIPHGVLQNPMNMYDKPIAVRMSWAATRNATRTEDIAYSLFGIFEVNLPLLYGEGSRAFTRLQHEIVRQSNDQSIFNWNSPGHGYCPLFATAPIDFENTAGDQFLTEKLMKAPLQQPQPYAVTNAGLNIDCKIIPYIPGVWLAWIYHHEQTPRNESPFFFLSRRRTDLDTWCRVKLRDVASCTVDQLFLMLYDHDIWAHQSEDRLQKNFCEMITPELVAKSVLHKMDLAPWIKIFIELKPDMKGFTPVRTAYGMCLKMDRSYGSFALVSNLDWNQSVYPSSKWSLENLIGEDFGVFSGLFPLLPCQEGLVGAVFFASPVAGLDAIILGFNRHFRPTAIIIDDRSQIDMKTLFKSTYPFQTLERFKHQVTDLVPYLNEIMSIAFGTESENCPHTKDIGIEILNDYVHRCSHWDLRARSDEHNPTATNRGYWHCNIYQVQGSQRESLASLQKSWFATQKRTRFRKRFTRIGL